MTKYTDLAERVLEGHVLTDEEALSILDSPDEELLLLLACGIYNSETVLWE